MENFNVLVTGGAGFIGSHLIENLIERGTKGITVIDNLSTGNYNYISKYVETNQIKFVKADLTSDNDSLKGSLKDIDTVFHFSAYPVVKMGYDNPKRSFIDDVQITFNLLESIRKSNVKNIVFSSSSAVYGKATIIPTPENYGPLIPISHYGSSKLACESLICSYCYNYGLSSQIFRLANVIGSRNNHGIIWDFINKIKMDKTKLSMLGDGSQKKSYIHIKDCIDGILHCVNCRSSERANIINIGNIDSVDVFTIAKIVSKVMRVDSIKFSLITATLDGSGWIGDVKNMTLDISKLKRIGFFPKHSSAAAIEKATSDILGAIQLSKCNS